MEDEFNGIERRLDELNDRLARLEPLKNRSRSDFDSDPYLRDIVERNLEISAQCVIDICNRIISIENAQRPADYYGAIMRMGEMGVLSADFALRLAPIAGFRNILVHGYIQIDWDQVYQNMQQLGELTLFAEHIRRWLAKK